MPWLHIDCPECEYKTTAIFTIYKLLKLKIIFMYVWKNHLNSQHLESYVFDLDNPEIVGNVSWWPFISQEDLYFILLLLNIALRHNLSAVFILGLWAPKCSFR